MWGNPSDGDTGGSWAHVMEDLEEMQTWEVNWFESIATPVVPDAATFAGYFDLSAIDLSPVADVAEGSTWPPAV